MTATHTSASDETPAAAPHRQSARRWMTRLALIAILLLGVYLRFLSLFTWDEPSSRLHPDERYLTDVASTLHVPSSFAEYLDSVRNPLNPRNYSKSTWYVYGLLPQTLTQFAAVMLTPNTALPACVERPDVPDPALQIGLRCNDPTVDAYKTKLVNNALAVPKLLPLQKLLNPEGRDLTGYYEIYKVGRAWSALFDLGSILLIFLIGRRLYGRRVGLLAALLLACAVLPIQLAHFFTVDAATGFFVLLAIYWGMRCSQRGGWPSFAALGLAIGGAMACRVTLAALGLIGVLAVAVRLFSGDKVTWWHADKDDAEHVTMSPPHLVTLSLMLALAGVLSVVTFRLLQSDAFVGSNFFDLRPEPRFVENIQRIGLYISGEADSPPGQQWARRVPYLFPLQNMLLWGFGLPLGLAALAGWAAAGWQLLRRGRLVHLIPWVWITFYFAWQGGQFVTTMRYYSSLYGLLALLAAWVLVRAVECAGAWATRATRGVGIARIAAIGATVAVVLGTALWAYAFTRIYTVPHARITASRWIYEHIPAGATITSEVWDDGLPLNVDGRSSGGYTGLSMQPYAEDEPSKYFGAPDANGVPQPGLLDQLDQADYLIYSSNRVYDSTKRLPMKYPALTRYWNALFEGKLGFKLVADIHSYPTLFGIEIPTPVLAEEAFSVYDHPRVLIFQKTPEYTRSNAQKLITDGVAWAEVYKLSSFVGGKVPTALRLTEAQWSGYRTGGVSILPSLFGSLAPWLVWLVVLELLGFAMFALLFRMLPRLPDRGFALSKTLGLLVVAWAAWLLASLGASDGRPLLSFSPLSVWLCAALLIIPGALVGWHTRFQLVVFWRTRRTMLLTAEGLFLAAFFGFVIIRALNPDLWHPARGGEKPMDLAFLTATLRSAAFPPYDPWFAGGYINYYYFGFVFVGTLVHLSGVAPTVAYNLAVPTIFALTALGAFGIGFNLLAVRSQEPGARSQTTDDGRRTTDDGRPTTDDGRPTTDDRLLNPEPRPLTPRLRHERRAIATGLVAALFVLLLGPLTQAIWLLPGSADPADQASTTPCQIESQYLATSYAAQQACRGRAEWAFWDATRIIGTTISRRTGGNDGTISEFPFFTFLFGDLHAHMIALPLALAALGLMLAVACSGEWRVQSEENRLRVLFHSALLTLLLSLVVGALAATNTWDYPAYLGLSVLTLGFVAWRRWQAGGHLWRELLLWGAASVALAVLARLLFLPFHRSFATEYAGFTRWTGDSTGAAVFLKINGLWLALLLFGVLALYRRLRGYSINALALVGTLALLLALAAALLDVPALALLVPLLGVAIGVVVDLLVRGDERRGGPVSMAVLLPALWACAAIGLALLTEVIVAKGDIGRMNTVFKLGMQSWTLFALASAVAFTSLWYRQTTTIPVARRSLSIVWLARIAAVALVAAGLVYPLTATPAKLADRFDTTIAPTLDGTAYMHSPQARWGENGTDFALGEDADALDWMRRNISGAPIVLEAQTEGYRWGGRVSIYTGLPTLLGWPWHETQQRSVAQVQPVLDSRRNLVQTLYSDTDTAKTLAMLRQYGIEYVYDGQLEQALYDRNGLAKFDRMASAGQLETVYNTGQTRIYHVRDVQNPPALLTTSLPVVAPALAPQKSALLDRSVDTLPVVPEYAWNGLAQSQPVAIGLWLLTLAALAALGLPVAALVFGRWRAGGLAFAPLLGLLMLGYAVWLPVSAGLWKYDRWGLAFGVVLVVIVDAVALALLGRRTTDGEPAAARASALSMVLLGARSLVLHVRGRWRSVALTGGLFLGAFAVLLLVRALNPDLWQPTWGGEKPFEFGFLNAILRSPVMPPYDPFYSGGTINYYYYGLYLVSLPLKATGIAPAVGFNLIIPTLFAMTLTGAFAIARQLTGRISYGLIGAAFVTVVGNLAAVFPTDGSQSKGLKPVGDALISGLPNFGSQLGDWFVGPSRVIPYTINEFPFWSFLFADLHPHLIALPITLLAVALALALVDEGRRTAERGQQSLAFVLRLPSAVLAALTLGALAVTNSWDFPTYTLLLAAALVGAVWLERRMAGWKLVVGVLGALAQAALIACAALLLYLPFFQNFKAMVGGIGLVPGGTMPESYAAIYGLFLLVLVPSIVLALWRVASIAVRRAARTALVPDRALGFVARAATPPRAIALLPVAVGVLLLVTAAVQHQNPMVLKLAQIGALLGCGALLLNRRLAPTTWFALLLAALGFAVSIGIDTVFIRDHLAGDASKLGDFYRMNTVFKFGMQIWTLLALASAALLPLLLRGLRRVSAALEITAAGAIAAVAALALIYPLAGTPSRVAYRFPIAPGPTLDGLAFMETGTYDWNGNVIDLRDDGEAIRWLNAHIDGTPVVLQSSMEFYRAYGVRVAANTGLPTVVSPLHEREQRDPGLVADRDADVNTFYRTTDMNEALRLLSKYRVGYVYVGPIERAGYGQAGMAKFAQMSNAYLAPVFKNATVTIYKVNDAVYSFPSSTGDATSVTILPLPNVQPVPATQPNQDAPAQPTLAELEKQNNADPQAAGPAFGLGQRYHDLGRLDDAAKVLALAAVANPSDVALHHLWGDTLRDARRYDEAVQAYTLAAQAQPTAGNYNKLGSELVRMARFDQAEIALNEATRIDPQMADPYFQLGLLYEQQDKRDQARDAYTRFISLAAAGSGSRAAAEAALKRLR